MKRYKLKKDLPTFKAGDEFFISKTSGNLCLANESCIAAYTKATLDKFPNILKDWFEEIPEQPKTMWDLEVGDKYYDIDIVGVISQQTFSGSFFDKQCRRMGNMFLTCREAEKELARRKAKQILLRDTKGFKPDWKEDNCKYEVVYDYEDEELWVDDILNSSTHSDLWFATEEDAKASIKAHEKEWKNYLGIEE